MSPAQFQRFKQFCAIANQYTQEYPHEFQGVSGQQIWRDLIQVAMALGVVSNRQEFETGWNVLMAEDAFNLPAYEPNQGTDPEASQADPLPEGMGGQIVSVLKAFRVQVDYLGEIPGPTFTRHQLKPRLGVKVSGHLCSSHGPESPSGVRRRTNYFRSVRLCGPGRTASGSAVCPV